MTAPVFKGNSEMRIVIVGAGVAGLTLGYLLLQKGCEVTILEKEAALGGLAKSFYYDNWSIDIGPHRFYTDDQEVMDFINRVMADSLLSIPRDSKVFFKGKHLDWPLSLKSLTQLPPKLMIQSIADLIARPKSVNESFESYVLSQYGKTITEHFFRGYTQKFLGLALHDCHKNWAEASIDRAIIDKDIRSSNIIDLLFGAVKNRKVGTTFYYPANGPIGLFPIRLAREVVKKGGTIVTNARPEMALIKNNRVKKIMDINDQGHKLDFLFWSGSTSSLEKTLRIQQSELDYCDTLLCNILVRGIPCNKIQWEYFSSQKIVFSRISINTSFNPHLAPDGCFGVCAEIIFPKGNLSSKTPEKYETRIIDSLIDTKIIKDKNAILDIRFEKVFNTYPIYKIDYLKQLKMYQKKISQFKNIAALGRTGAFWYNNMDQSIRAAMNIANHFVGESLDE